MHISNTNNKIFRPFKNNTSFNKRDSQKKSNSVESYSDSAANHPIKSALGAFAGAITPVIAINACKKGRLNNVVNSFKNKLPIKNKAKAIWDMLEIENYNQILATTTGGVAGGLIEGLKYSETKGEKESKYKEGIFEFLNNMTPTTLVALGTYYSKKTGKLKSIPEKSALIFGSVVFGMFLANKTSNKINQKIFDKDKLQKETRKFKPSDCLVHTDDLLNLAVLTKIPIANKLQIDKLLPLIYARSGYEVATANGNQISD